MARRLIPCLLCFAIGASGCGEKAPTEARIVFDAGAEAGSQNDASLTDASRADAATKTPDAAAPEEAGPPDAALSECNDGIDNDDDGFIDDRDFGCTPDANGETTGLTEDSCTEDASCGNNLTCVDGRCASPCNDQQDCNANQVCKDGLCIVSL